MAESTALLWMRKYLKKKKKKKKMDDGVAIGTSLASGDFILFYLLTCGRRSLVSGTQNDIVVS